MSPVPGTVFSTGSLMSGSSSAGIEQRVGREGEKRVAREGSPCRCQALLISSLNLKQFALTPGPDWWERGVILRTYGAHVLPWSGNGRVAFRHMARAVLFSRPNNRPSLEEPAGLSAPEKREPPRQILGIPRRYPGARHPSRRFSGGRVTSNHTKVPCIAAPASPNLPQAPPLHKQRDVAFALSMFREIQKWSHDNVCAPVVRHPATSSSRRLHVRV